MWHRQDKEWHIHYWLFVMSMDSSSLNGIECTDRWTGINKLTSLTHVQLTSEWNQLLPLSLHFWWISRMPESFSETHSLKFCFQLWIIHREFIIYFILQAEVKGPWGCSKVPYYINEAVSSVPELFYSGLHGMSFERSKAWSILVQQLLPPHTLAHHPASNDILV